MWYVEGTAAFHSRALELKIYHRWKWVTTMFTPVKETSQIVGSIMTVSHVLLCLVFPKRTYMEVIACSRRANNTKWFIHFILCSFFLCLMIKYVELKHNISSQINNPCRCNPKWSAKKKKRGATVCQGQSGKMYSNIRFHFKRFFK